MVGRSSAVAVVIGFLLALPAASGAAGWTTVPGTPSAATGTAEEPTSVAVDPQGNLWLAFSEDSGGTGTRLHVYERPPGGSFVSVLDEPEPDVGPPAIAAGADGTVAVAFETLQSSVVTPNLAIRPPGGTFGTPLQGSTNAVFSPMVLSVLPDGTALFAWLAGTSPNRHLHVASAKAGGALVDETPTGVGSDPELPRFASNASGNAVVAWDDSLPGGVARIAFSERPPGGSFMAAAQEIASRTLNTPSETAQANVLDSVALDDAGDLAATAGLSVSSSGSTTASVRVHVRPAGEASFQHATLETGAGSGFGPISTIALTPDRAATVVSIGIDGGLFSSAATAGGGFAFSPEVPFTGVVTGTCLGIEPTGSVLLAPLAGGGGIAGLYSDMPFTMFCPGAPLTPIAPGITGSGVPPAIEPLGAGTSALVPDAHGDAFAAVSFSPEQAAVPVVAYDATPPSIGAISVPQLVAAGKPAALSVSASDAISSVSVAWSFGDSRSGSGTAVTHTWAKPGSYTVSATATDGAVNTASTSSTVVVKDRTPPTISHVSVKRRTARFTLSEKATVKLVVKRKHHRKSRTLKRRGLRAGKRSVKLGPRHGKHALAPGRYTLTITATDPAGNKSRQKVVKFKVRRS